jgi:hypothetical protein
MSPKQSDSALLKYLRGMEERGREQQSPMPQHAFDASDQLSEELRVLERMHGFDMHKGYGVNDDRQFISLSELLRDNKAIGDELEVVLRGK